MNPIQKFHQLRILHNCFIPLYSCCTHAASRCTRVINLMSLLGRAFRIDPESHAFSCLFRHSSKAKKLGRRIKYNMIGILKKFLEFIRPVTCTEYMNLFSLHFLCTQSCLIQSTGLCTRQIRFKKRITIIITECFLCQKHLTSCPFCYFTEQFCVFCKCFFIQYITRCFDVLKFRRNNSAGGCKWCSFI